MVLDSSAIVAIHLRETGHERLIDAVERAEIVAIGAPTLLEAAMVLSTRLARDARPLLLDFVRQTNAEIVPFREDHFAVACSAFQRFGRGRHPAGLNFGDCMSYAVAALARMPLLFTGSDFTRTDIPGAL